MEARGLWAHAGGPRWRSRAQRDVSDGQSAHVSDGQVRWYIIILVFGRFWTFLLFLAVAASFPQSFPPISTYFRHERPNFHPRRHFFGVSVRHRHVCVRQKCLCGTQMSVRGRDVCAAQRCLSRQRSCRKLASRSPRNILPEGLKPQGETPRNGEGLRRAFVK